MHLRYSLIDAWPPLAWLARCPSGGGPVEVLHGRGVEVTDDWFCEAVWDGSFTRGDFDRTDLVFGSGGRRRHGVVTFVASGSTVDRLHSLEREEATWVSNSLPCLLATTGGTVDPTYPHYFADFKSIRRGLRRYSRGLATSAGTVVLTYFHNLAWDGRALQEAFKPNIERPVTTFAGYRDFLSRTIADLAANMGAHQRANGLRLLGTISSGYDSATAAALARPHGMEEALSFGSSSSGDPDSGEVIADVLGVRLTIFARHAWRAAAFPEVPFVAADAKGEDVYFKGAEAMVAGRVLLTGFHGDRVWDRSSTTNEDLVRGDQSGLSLSEYRLWVGFLHCPLPFAGVRQAATIRSISRSREMARWDSGGHYSRPICRRILEEAGVPRDAFGRWKKTASVLFFAQEGFLSPASLVDYRQWLAHHAHEWHRRRLAPPTLSADDPDPWRGPRNATARLLEGLAHMAPRRLWYLRSAAQRIVLLGRRERLFHHLFPWAVEHAKRRYAGVALERLLEQPRPLAAGARLYA